MPVLAIVPAIPEHDVPVHIRQHCLAAGTHRENTGGEKCLVSEHMAKKDHMYFVQHKLEKLENLYLS